MTYEVLSGNGVLRYYINGNPADESNKIDEIEGPVYPWVICSSDATSCKTTIAMQERSYYDFLIN